MSVLDSTATIRPIRQYSRAGVLGIWAAAALPLALLSWVVTPALAGAGAARSRFVITLICAMTVGLAWQFVLVLILVVREQHNLRWSTLRGALWLQPPVGPTGRRGGRTWLWVVPLIVAFGLASLIPGGLSGPADRNLGTFLRSAAGRATFHGSWGLFALVAVMLVFNTVLGEELLFRGWLLPRMHTAFGRADWIANGVLFALYHLNEPWAIPTAMLSGVFLLAWPVKRWRSTWFGIVVHSAQSVFFLIALLALVV